jgi:hypothetical protein
MMRDKSDMPTGDAVEASIARVLAAEAAALDTVAQARDEAAAMAERAREEARRIAAQVASLEAQTAAMDAAHELTPEEIADVERAVRATASALTGGPS